MRTPAGPHNWGRWGVDDELGALNFLTPEAVQRGAACVRSGERFSLTLPLDLPNGRGHGRPELSKVAFRRNSEVLGFVANDDYVILALQGSTQWDSFIHCGVAEAGVDGVFYNGVGTDAVDEDGYAHRNGIDKVAQAGIAGRGLLLDVARMVTGSPTAALPTDFVITDDVIVECRRAQRIEPAAGDIVCIRTGFAELYLRSDADTRRQLLAPTPGKRSLSAAGISPSIAPLVQREQWAAIAADNPAVESSPMAEGSAAAHTTIQRNLGVLFGEWFLFDALAEAAARDGRYEFLFTAAPLWIPGGMGSPGCALAIR